MTQPIAARRFFFSNLSSLLSGFLNPSSAVAISLSFTSLVLQGALQSSRSLVFNGINRNAYKRTSSNLIGLDKKKSNWLKICLDKKSWVLGKRNLHTLPKPHIRIGGYRNTAQRFDFRFMPLIKSSTASWVASLRWKSGLQNYPWHL